MAEPLITSGLLSFPHGFLTGPQSGARRFDLVASRPAPVFVKQVHSAKAVRIDEPIAEDSLPEADALVTDRPGVMLGIVTADCAPVLLADEVAGVIGAAHAGWRGAVGGVLEATLEEMERLGARRERMVAAIGPAIAQASYEVDEPLRAQFTAPDDEQFFTATRAGNYQFDLERYVAHRLKRGGIGFVDPLGIDTYAHPDRFESYRRTTHRGRSGCGRQFSLIALRA